MAYVLMVIGFGWAGLGIANICTVFMTGDVGLQALALIFNMVLFVLPGLITGAIGWRTQ